MFGIRDIDIWFPAEASQYIGIWESSPCRVTFFHYFCTWNERTKTHTGIQCGGAAADPARGLCGQKPAYPSRWVLSLPHGERCKYHVAGSCGRLCDLPFPFLLVYPFYRLGPRQWVPFAGNLFPAGVLRSGNRCDIGLAAPCAACNRVDKFVPEPFVSGTIRPHVPSGAAKHRFHRVFSLIGRITGRCPYLAKTDPFYILKHRIILCIHLGA